MQFSQSQISCAPLYVFVPHESLSQVIMPQLLQCLTCCNFSIEAWHNKQHKAKAHSPTLMSPIIILHPLEVWNSLGTELLG